MGGKRRPRQRYTSDRTRRAVAGHVESASEIVHSVLTPADVSRVRIGIEMIRSGSLIIEQAGKPAIVKAELQELLLTFALASKDGINRLSDIVSEVEKNLESQQTYLGVP